MFFQKELPCFESFARGFPLMEGDEKNIFFNGTWSISGPTCRYGGVSTSNKRRPIIRATDNATTSLFINGHGLPLRMPKIINVNHNNKPSPIMWFIIVYTPAWNGL
jgi:hypothetical protein